MDKWIGALISLAFAMFGGLLVYRGIEAAVELRRQERWPTVDGVVVQSETGRAGDHIRVTFDYQVGGRSFRREMKLDELPQATTKRLQARYPVGGRVAVYHDPLDPGRSVLEHGSQAGNVMVVVFGLIILIPALLILVLFSLLIYVDFQMMIARRHLQKGLVAMEEGRELVREIREQGGEVPPELLEMEERMLARAREVGQMYVDLKGEVEGEEQPSANNRPERE